MKTDGNNKWSFALLLVAWLLVVVWQVEEHHRVVEAAKSDLRIRSHEIAGTLGAVTRALKFRGAVFQHRLEPVLNELVSNRITNSSQVKLIYVGLLNTNGEPIAAVGDTNLFSHVLLTANEVWSKQYVTFILPVEGASLLPNFTNDFSRNEPDGFHHREPPPDDFPRTEPEDFRHHEPPPDFDRQTNSENSASSNLPPPPDEGRHPRGGFRRPWMHFMSKADFKNLIATHEWHGLVLAMSTENFRAVCRSDLWLRVIISFFAGVSALGAGLAWRGIGKSTDLQIRLVRASEMNSHLKEMNLAAAGLAHETRNPLNIIRGQAQMISRQSEINPDIREKSKIIVDETDKVTAQLTEFINYSRPREVRRTKIALLNAANEVVRTLSYDIGEKKLQVTVGGDALAVEADEQLLRQVLFNLLLNAIQAVGENGKIQIAVQRANVAEAVLEVRDDGPGVAPENRQEIFRPYFTTHQKGTGLGLAVVQQNVQAHGWEITCSHNEPRGAIFRVTHLKIAT